jgi:hypothetical protein
LFQLLLACFGKDALNRAAIQKRDQEQDVGMTGGRYGCPAQAVSVRGRESNIAGASPPAFPASSFQAASNRSISQHAGARGRAPCAPSVNLEPAGKVCYACGLTSSHTRLDAGVGYIHSP